MDEIKLIIPSLKYGEDILKFRQELIEANDRDRNIEKIMITCSRHNTASEKVILSNGGIFEKEVIVDGEHIKRYWITL